MNSVRRAYFYLREKRKQTALLFFFLSSVHGIDFGVSVLRVQSGIGEKEAGEESRSYFSCGERTGYT